jgi:O-antigen/teichoic acid export membrane protein
MQQMHYSGALGIIEEICFAALGLATLALGGGITAVVICRVVAQAATQLIAVTILTKKLHIRPQSVSYEICKSLIMRARHFFGVSVFTAAAHNLDVVLLLSMQGAAAVGIYAAAAKLVKMTTYFSKAFSDALYPVLSKQAALADRRALAETYRQSLKWLMIAVVPLVSFATAQSATIMQSLYGPGFVEASFVFLIFAWRAGLGFLTQFCGNTLFALERQATVFKATGMGAVTSLLLYVILIPYYSYTGAAIAASAALVVEFLLQFIGVNKRLRFSLAKAFLFKAVTAGIGMAVFCALFDFVPLIPLAVLGFLVYGGCLIALGAISREELQVALRSSMTLLQRRTVREV